MFLGRNWNILPIRKIFFPFIYDIISNQYLTQILHSCQIKTLRTVYKCSQIVLFLWQKSKLRPGGDILHYCSIRTYRNCILHYLRVRRKAVGQLSCSIRVKKCHLLLDNCTEQHLAMVTYNTHTSEGE